jgi:hypothetical protein
MQEFESISASSYDPSALATKLTAKAADGWSVVAIVPTGGDVTAFVTREKSGDGESPMTTETSEPATEEPEEASSLVVPAPAEPAADSNPEPTPDTQPDAVSEPSGWAIAPEPPTPSTPTPEPASSQPALTVQPGASYQPAATPSYEPAATPTPEAATPTPSATTPAPAAATPAPTAPAVPAGWYADPAGRFELRYWDGSTWTEHVSRSGQQFTDPPVA